MTAALQAWYKKTIALSINHESHEQREVEIRGIVKWEMDGSVSKRCARITISALLLLPPFPASHFPFPL